MAEHHGDSILAVFYQLLRLYIVEVEAGWKNVDTGFKYEAGVPY